MRPAEEKVNWPLLLVLCSFVFVVVVGSQMLGYLGILTCFSVLVVFYVVLDKQYRHNPGLSNSDVVLILSLLFSMVIFDSVIVFADPATSMTLWVLTVLLPTLLIRKFLDSLPTFKVIVGLKRKLMVLTSLSGGLSLFAFWYRTVWFIPDKDRILMDTLITVLFVVVFPVSVVASLLFESNDKNIKASVENKQVCS